MSENTPSSGSLHQKGGTTALKGASCVSGKANVESYYQEVNYMNTNLIDDSINICDKDIHMYFYRCEECGRMVASKEELEQPLSCCNKEMTLLIPQSDETASEKHVPMYTVEGHTLLVTVGSVPHPMTKEHHIEWICLVTSCSVQWQPLSEGSAPVASFRIRKGEKIKAIYEYCNIHGLWLYEESPKWRCTVCGYEYNGDPLPQHFTCPQCGAPSPKFEKMD